MSNSTMTMTTTIVQTHAHFRLNDLPYELQYEIIKYASDDGWGRMTVLDMACVNSHFNEIATKLMNEYKFNHLTDLDGYTFQGFIKAMVSDDGTRAMRMRRLHLTTSWCEHAYYSEWAKYATETSLTDRFGIWAMESMSKLEELLVAYPPGQFFMDPLLPPKLQTLIVRPEGLPGFRFKGEGQNPVELAGTVNASFLETALRSKSLKTLDLGGQMVVNETFILSTEDLPFKESPIERLKLTVGNFNDEALLKLFRAPRGLRSLEFIPPTFEDVNYQDTRRKWSSILPAAFLPAFSTLGTGLAAQAATLERLIVRRGDAHWTPLLDRIGSLAGFPVLKHLDIDCTTLLGWHHCKHLQPHDQNKAMPPSALTPFSLPVSKP